MRLVKRVRVQVFKFTSIIALVALAIAVSGKHLSSSPSQSTSVNSQEEMARTFVTQASQLATRYHR
ncbi:MAG: hypothetical protein WAN66_06170 [Limnoraphis robusta]|uniref:Uncharacterized protein n=1 Tax=Limnoraphis robusta CCNP1315 TaxID=3110306 RepID=A0ABU5TWP4_9CYAN|nr:hypothetical protein [Limnoraphis robusta]MEA5500021.1 hypothetical protein [Limnoraphis robusta BA-68 BA1]MEA5519331.1 hypothetical protein [Limnoraphis robusta CCNP1315]MEA5545589.1 hypothetical protein [Limnoraphis robusta CCNP1324]